jgi:parvulin-like peptidyl-prolyl isomerase
MYRLLTLLLFSSIAFAQTTAPAQKPQPPAAKAPSAQTHAAPSTAAKTTGKAEVPPTAPVITIAGLCNGKVPATPSPTCKTVVTRAQFERLADALQPNMPAPRRQQLADAYSRMLVMSDIAEQRGLANTPEAKQILEFTRMQALMQLLGRDLQLEASKVPPAETEKYYNEHAQQFEQGTLQRIFIPKTPPGGEKPADEKSLEAEGQKIHAAAAAPRADFEKLQKQAYDDLGLKTPPPPTSAGSMSRGSLPPSQAKVFDLQPGQVSEVMNEPGGLYIFKLESKKKLTLPEVTPEINRTLEQERLRAEVDKLTNMAKPELNQQYFGAPAGPAGMPDGTPPPGPPSHPPATLPPAKPPSK